MGEKELIFKRREGVDMSESRARKRMEGGVGLYMRK